MATCSAHRRFCHLEALIAHEPIEWAADAPRSGLALHGGPATPRRHAAATRPANGISGASGTLASRSSTNGTITGMAATTPTTPAPKRANKLRMPARRALVGLTGFTALATGAVSTSATRSSGVGIRHHRSAARLGRCVEPVPEVLRHRLGQHERLWGHAELAADPEAAGGGEAEAWAIRRVADDRDWP